MKQPLNSKIDSETKTSGPVAGALIGTTGIAVLSAAAVGVAGYFAWKNREKILSFVGNYIDLPESLKQDEDVSAPKADVGTLASSKSTYTQPTVEHRM